MDLHTPGEIYRKTRCILFSSLLVIHLFFFFFSFNCKFEEKNLLCLIYGIMRAHLCGVNKYFVQRCQPLETYTCGKPGSLESFYWLNGDQRIRYYGDDNKRTPACFFGEFEM